MTNKKRKKFIVPFYLFIISIICTSIYFMEKTFNNDTFINEEKMEYVDKEIVTDYEYIPVVAEQTTILKPFLIDEITTKNTYYNYQGESQKQEDSLIYYENTYMQNSGIDYEYSDKFDIISILDGTVIEITDNEILGKTIKIRHNNDIISVYQSLSEINVKKDDLVLRGQIIGKSGTCNLYSEKSNLHFELYYQGKSINPEEYYNKTENELMS